jgi:uncharacterized protein (UPF0248 family)
LGGLKPRLRDNTMKPVQEMLSRIRWDPDWANDEFTIGYYDRVERRIVIVAFKDIRFPQDDHFSFELVGQSSEAHSIPYHRVRVIYRSGRLIWTREAE